MTTTEDIRDDGWEVAEEDTVPCWLGARDKDDLSEPEPEWWDLGDDVGNEAYAWTTADDGPGGPIADMLAAGHGFTVTKPSGLPEVMSPCRHCGGPLYPVSSWHCEVTLELFTLSTDIGCRCSWCVINRGGDRPPGKGRPRKHCGRPACVKAQRKQDNATAYQRRKVKAAIQ